MYVAVTRTSGVGRGTTRLGSKSAYAPTHSTPAARKLTSGLAEILTAWLPRHSHLHSWYCRETVLEDLKLGRKSPSENAAIAEPERQVSAEYSIVRVAQLRALGLGSEPQHRPLAFT